MPTDRFYPSAAVSLTLAILAICIVSPVSLRAQEPIQVYSVEGSFDAGSLVTIQGTGFGQKSPAHPVLWDDFENGTVGQQIDGPILGTYHRVSSSIVYTDEGVYSGTRSAYEWRGNNWINGLVSRWSDSTQGATSSFAHMVIRMRSDTGSLTTPDSKILRLNSWDPDATHGEPNVILGLSSSSAHIWHVSNLGFSNQTYAESITSEEFNDPHNQWFSIGLWTRMGDRGVANGFVGRDFNGNVRERHNVVTLGESSPFTGTRSAYFVGHTGLQGSEWLEWWIGEVYADTTLARVAVYHPEGGHPAGGPTAMQIPQTWSANSINILVNPGFYPTGTQLLLVVYNGAGAASEPFVVIVGENSGSGDQGPPGDPSPVTMAESID